MMDALFKGHKMFYVVSHNHPYPLAIVWFLYWCDKISALLPLPSHLSNPFLSLEEKYCSFEKEKKAMYFVQMYTSKLNVFYSSTINIKLG